MRSVLIGICWLTVAAAPAAAICPDLEKVTVPPGGGPASGDSWSPQISADGRHLAFLSRAANLDPSRPAAVTDVLLLDRDTGSLVRVTRSADGMAAADVMDEESVRFASLSADGRHVAFTSDAANMVADDVEDVYADVYVWDRDRDAIEKVTRAHDGGSANAASQWPSISGDGRYVVFESESTGLIAGDAIDGTSDVFRWDREDGAIEKVSQTAEGEPGVSSSRQPVISADGRYVAFITDAPNLVGESNPYPSFVVWDAQTKLHEQVARGAPMSYFGEQPVVISADGSSMALLTQEPLNPGDERPLGYMLYRWDRATGTYTLVTRAAEPWEQPSSQGLNFALAHTLTFFEPNVTLSSVVIYTDYTYSSTYVESQDYELVTDGDGYTTVVRLESGAIPPDGTALAFFSYTRNGANGSVYSASISPDGRFVGFVSDATNLGPGGSMYAPPQVFVWDGETLEIERISTEPGGGEGNSDSRQVSLSAGADKVAIASNSWNLVPGDTDDGVGDLFVGSPCLAPEPSLGLLQVVVCLVLAGFGKTRRLPRPLGATVAAIACGLLLAAVPPASAQPVEAASAVRLDAWVSATFAASPTLDPGHDDIMDGTSNDLVATGWLEQASTSASFHEIYQGIGESGTSRFETDYQGSASLSTGTVGSDVLAVDLNNASASYWTTFASAEYYEWLELSGPTDPSGNYVIDFTIELGPFVAENMQPQGFTAIWRAGATAKVIAEPLDTNFAVLDRSVFATLTQACPTLDPCFGYDHLLINTGEVTVPGATPVLRVSHSSFVSARSASADASASSLHMQLPAGVTATSYQPLPEPGAALLQLAAIGILRALLRMGRSAPEAGRRAPCALRGASGSRAARSERSDRHHSVEYGAK